MQSRELQQEEALGNSHVEIRRATADGEDEPLTFPEIEEEHCSARTPEGRKYDKFWHVHHVLSGGFRHVHLGFP
jgi:hypothetical protein